MAVIKNEKTGKWEVRTYYEDWTGERKQKTKRGFEKKQDAVEWERAFKLQKHYDMSMTFSDFVEVYSNDMKPRLRLNTWNSKEHIIRTKILISSDLIVSLAEGKADNIRTTQLGNNGCQSGAVTGAANPMREIRNRIDYEALLQEYPFQDEMIDGICELMLEIEASQSESIVIASSRLPVELVRERFRKLRYDHIHYVMDCILANTTKVRNIRKYMLAALFNAPATIDGYYQAEVNHDMPELARR